MTQLHSQTNLTLVSSKPNQPLADQLLQAILADDDQSKIDALVAKIKQRANLHLVSANNNDHSFRYQLPR